MASISSAGHWRFRIDLAFAGEPVFQEIATGSRFAGPNLGSVGKIPGRSTPNGRDQKPKPSEPIPDDRLESLGDIALENRNFDKSLINYIQILKDHPERYDLHYKVGVIFLMSGKLEAAQKELALVLVHQPEMLKAHEAMGLVYLQGKQYPLAIDEFQYVLAQDPKRPKTHHLLGVTFLESGRPERAIIANCNMAITLDPRQLSSFIALAQAYLQRKDYPHATATLKQAQALAPENHKGQPNAGTGPGGPEAVSPGPGRPS